MMMNALHCAARPSSWYFVVERCGYLLEMLKSETYIDTTLKKHVHK